MQVVLNENVKHLGYKGEVVSVKRGYFRNFLAPRGLADYASESRLKLAESRKDKLVMQKQQVLENAKEVMTKLGGLSVAITKKVADSGKLYGSVVEEDVVEAISAAAKVDLDPSMIKMEHFKDTGDHEVVVHLGEGHDAKVKVVIEAQKA